MAGRCYLNAGHSLLRGQQLISPNKLYNLNHQYDGNVVLYNGDNVIWSTNTYGNTTTEFIMQKDGNLVLYNKGKALWASNTHGKGGVVVILMDNGDVGMWDENHKEVFRFGTGIGIFAGTFDHDKLPVSGTLPRHGSLLSENGKYALKIDNDGSLGFAVDNIVQQTIAGSTGGKYLTLQNDGNLVYYDDSEKALWASNTRGSGAKAVMILNDNTLALVDDEFISMDKVEGHVIKVIVDPTEL